jgi:hypothetical protein
MSVSKATVRSVASDGTNIFLEVEVYNGDITLPLLRPVFPVGTTAADITTYLQTIANNRPVAAQAINELINVTITGS